MMRTWRATWRITIPSAVAKNDLRLDVLKAPPPLWPAIILSDDEPLQPFTTSIADCLLPGC